MPEILHNGKQKPTHYTTTCQRCHTVARFNVEAEAKLMADARDGDAYVFTCPVCGASILVAVTLLRQQQSTPDASRLLQAVAAMVEADPHQWSSRPCQTCRAVSALIGRPFGCSRQQSC